MPVGWIEERAKRQISTERREVVNTKISPLETKIWMAELNVIQVENQSALQDMHRDGPHENYGAGGETSLNRFRAGVDAMIALRDKIEKRVGTCQ